MSNTSAIVITVLVIVVIGLAITLAVTLSGTSSDKPTESTEGTVTSKTELDVTVEDSSDVVKGSSERETCMIKISNDDGTEETIPVGEPWYLDPNNNKRCFAPTGQQCCEQIDLPSGEEGCMIDFTGYTPTKISEWKNECLGTGRAIDMEKLGILNSHFAGDWIVEEKDGEESDEDIQFTVEVSGVNLKLKKDERMYGLYNITHITVNPNKHIQAKYTSDSGTTTDIIVDEDSNGNTMLRIVETPANTDEGQLTTYKLSKI